jgi:hypothetical protein
VEREHAPNGRDQTLEPDRFGIELVFVTRPAFRGSFSLPKTMGMVVVAALAATVATEPAGAAITLTDDEPIPPPAPGADRTMPEGIRW